MLSHILTVAHAIIREHIVKKVSRSSEWPTVRKNYLAEHPTCAACGGRLHAQVHHMVPFHEDPTLELHPDNLITLCMGSKNECHIKIGHGCSFKQYNPNVALDAQDALEHPEKVAEIIARAELNRKPNDPGDNK